MKFTIKDFDLSISTCIGSSIDQSASTYFYIHVQGIRLDVTRLREIPELFLDQWIQGWEAGTAYQSYNCYYGNSHYCRVRDFICDNGKKIKTTQRGSGSYVQYEGAFNAFLNPGFLTVDFFDDDAGFRFSEIQIFSQDQGQKNFKDYVAGRGMSWDDIVGDFLQDVRFGKFLGNQTGTFRFGVNE